MSDNIISDTERGTPLVLLELLSKASNQLLKQARNIVNVELLMNFLRLETGSDVDVEQLK